MPAVPLGRNDLLHLHAQLAAATKGKLDLYLPNTDADDALKQKVGAHVDEFVLQLFGALDGNVVVDGEEETGTEAVSVRDILEGNGSQKAEIEPFDFNLAEQVRKLWVQVEQETVKLASLRKEGPEQLKRQYEESFEALLNETLAESALDDEEEEDEEDVPDTSRLERLAAIEESYRDAVGAVLRLKEEIPGQRNELLKIEKVAQFLSSEK